MPNSKERCIFEVSKEIEIMTTQFYILIEGERKNITPEPEEVKSANAAIQWGMKRGIVSLKSPIRTSTTYWEVV